MTDIKHNWDQNARLLRELEAFGILRPTGEFRHGYPTYLMTELGRLRCPEWAADEVIDVNEKTIRRLTWCGVIENAIERDLRAMERLGLVERVGVTADGETIWGLTELGCSDALSFQAEGDERDDR